MKHKSLCQKIMGTRVKFNNDRFQYTPKVKNKKNTTES